MAYRLAKDRPGRSRRQADPSPAQAKPRRPVCAPAAMAFSFYRRPGLGRRIVMSFFPWLLNTKAQRGAQDSRSSATRFRPQIEVLEGRDVPSTLTVTNNLDSGPGSLRAEIAAAKSGDTVAFAPSIGLINLSSGELVINKNLTIQGPGAGLQTISTLKLLYQIP